MKEFFDKIKSMITAKAVISAVSLGLFLPFIKLIYWVFDTAYLSGFGITPDVYSRPIFSSGFISAWLFAGAMTPIFIGWALFSVVIFVVLFSINFESLAPPKQREDDKKSSEKESEFSKFITSIIDALSKSIEWPSFIFISGFILIIFFVTTILHTHKNGFKLADEQISVYANEGKCGDKFNAKNVGCFNVSGIEGTNHFVIANLQTHLLYLSRRPTNESGSITCDKEYKVTLHIHEKKSDKQYSINRDYIFSETENSQPCQLSEK